MAKIIFKTNAATEKVWKAERVQQNKLQTNTATTKTFEKAFERLQKEKGGHYTMSEALYPSGTIQNSKEEEKKLVALREAADQEGILLPTEYNRSIQTSQHPGAEEVLLPARY